MSIPIYKFEVEAGLADIIRENTSVAYLSPVVKAVSSWTPSPELESAIAALAKPVEDVTLIYFEDILATSGWNLNRDIFTHDELWAARHSIDQKPINFGHQYTNIIGHVIGSQAVDANYKIIDEDTPFDDLPETFHVKNQSVLYRYIGDKERDNYMLSLEADIEQGKYFVSMESFFKGFDYGWWNEKTGEKKIITRNSTTAFLTKHLHQYKGTGYYEDPETGDTITLGRVIRNIHFKGKGIVQQPGNADSIIFSKSHTFSNFTKPSGYLPLSGLQMSAEISPQEPTMKTIEDLQAELTTALARITELEGQAGKAKHEQTIADLRAEVAELKTAKANLENDKTELSTKLSTEQTKAETFKTELETATTTIEGLETDLKTKGDALAKIEAAKVEADRLKFITDKGPDADTAAALVKKFAGFSDADFNEVVAVLEKSWTHTPPAQTVVSVKDKVEAEKKEINTALTNVESTQATMIVSDTASRANVVDKIVAAMNIQPIRRSR